MFETFHNHNVHSFLTPNNLNYPKPGKCILHFRTFPYFYDQMSPETYYLILYHIIILWVRFHTIEKTHKYARSVNVLSLNYLKMSKTDSLSLQHPFLKMASIHKSRSIQIPKDKQAKCNKRAFGIHVE